MQIFDSYIDAGQELPRAEREKYYTSLIEFVAYGTEPRLKGAALAVFTAIRPSLELSKQRAANGSKGGSARKAKANQTAEQDGSKHEANRKQTRSKPQANTKQAPSKTEASEEANGQANSNSNSNSNLAIANTTTAAAYDGEGFALGGLGDEIVETPGGFPRFMARSMRAYNAATGQNVLALPVEAQMGLRQAYDNGRTIDDVEKVCRIVASWEPRYRTPKAAFGDKFEQWLNREEVEKDDYSYLDTPILDAD